MMLAFSHVVVKCDDNHFTEYAILHVDWFPISVD